MAVAYDRKTEEQSARHTAAQREEAAAQRHAYNGALPDADQHPSRHTGPLLRGGTLRARGNAAVQTALLQQMQQTYGNRAVQRFLQRQQDRSNLKSPALQRKNSTDVTTVQRWSVPTWGATCALTTYSGSNMTGKQVVTDVEFVDSLDAINKHAADNNVNLHITSSFRTSSKVKGAIVKPASKSNHMAGHAIDMNVLYGANKEKWCNSSCLGGNLSKPGKENVKGFIDAVRNDSGLRWGGDFADKDTVHIDDGLNGDMTAWDERWKATQEARKSGCG